VTFAWPAPWNEQATGTAEAGWRLSLDASPWHGLIAFRCRLSSAVLLSLVLPPSRLLTVLRKMQHSASSRGKLPRQGTDGPSDRLVRRAGAQGLASTALTAKLVAAPQTASHCSKDIVR
jgi:hypothetical protein